MVYAQPSIHPGKWNAQTSLGFWDTNRSPDLGQITRPYNNQQKRRICRIVNFAVPADNRVKLNKSEKKDKYLDLAREQKKLWSMKVMIIPIIIGALGTKGLIQGLEDCEIWGRVEKIQTHALLRLARILRRVLETWGDLLLLNSSEGPSANTDVKNSQRVTIIIIIKD